MTNLGAVAADTTFQWQHGNETGSGTIVAVDNDRGAIVGGWLISLLFGVDLTTGFNLTTLVVSAIGAVTVVALYRLITRRSVMR